MGRKSAILILGVVTVCGALLVVLRPLNGRRQLVVTSYFSDARSLKAGAPVQIAGVQIGYVKSVRVRTDLREGPAEVVMVIKNPYEVKVPSDAVVTLPSSGVLGETYAKIDIKNATGPPLESGGVLKSQPVESVTTKELLDKLNEIANRKVQQSSVPAPVDPEKQKK
jgi:ABC-type transporter Mla subunit MlaD